MVHGKSAWRGYKLTSMTSMWHLSRKPIGEAKGAETSCPAPGSLSLLELLRGTPKQVWRFSFTKDWAGLNKSVHKHTYKAGSCTLESTKARTALTYSTSINTFGDPSLTERATQSVGKAYGVNLDR